MKKILIIIIALVVIGCDKSLVSAIEASNKGVALIGESKVDEGRESLMKAKVIYEELLTEQPENILYQNNYGWVLMKLEEYEAAAIQFEKAIKNSQSINPSSAPSKNLAELVKLQAK